MLLLIGKGTKRSIILTSESIAFLISLIVDGRAGSSMVGRGVVFSIAVSVKTFFSRVQLLILLSPSLHLLSAVCDDVTRYGLEGGDLYGTGSKCFLYALILGTDVAARPIIT